MSRVLLNTSAYSRFMVGNPAVVEVVAAASEVNLNITVIGELYDGFLGGSRQAQNLASLAEFIEAHQVTVRPMTEATAREYSIIHQFLRKAGTPIPANDIWIAATAVEFDLELITFDAHFARIPRLKSTVLA